MVPVIYISINSSASLLSFLLNVFSISVCHRLKSVIYKKVCVYVCVYVCVCVWVGGCGYVMQDISKFKNLINLQRVAAGHQKATESEI